MNCCFISLKRGSALLLIAIFAQLFSPSHALAVENKTKFNPRASYREITAGAGLYKNMSLSHEGATEYYYIKYGHFFYNGFGVRAGFQYVPQLSSIHDAFGFPINAAYRINTKPTMSFDEALDAAAVASIDPYFSRGDFFASLLLALVPPKIEFFAGLTPGWVRGDAHYYYEYVDGVADPIRRGVEKKRSFTVSADMGMKLHYRIWRFTFNLIPGFHYYFTDNFKEIKRASTADVGRWYFSLSGGLGVML